MEVQEADIERKQKKKKTTVSDDDILSLKAKHWLRVIGSEPRDQENIC